MRIISTFCYDFNLCVSFVQLCNNRYPIIRLYCGLILFVYRKLGFSFFFLYVCIVLSYFIFYGLLFEINLDDAIICNRVARIARKLL